MSNLKDELNKCFIHVAKQVINNSANIFIDEKNSLWKLSLYNDYLDGNLIEMSIGNNYINSNHLPKIYLSDALKDYNIISSSTFKKYIEKISLNDVLYTQLNTFILKSINYYIENNKDIFFNKKFLDILKTEYAIGKNSEFMVLRISKKIVTYNEVISPATFFDCFIEDFNSSNE